MRYRHRCTRGRCRQRVTLNRPAAQYRGGKRCRACGGDLALDHYRHEHETGAQTRAGVCTCDGWWFPHRRGSLWCIHHPTGPDDDAMRARFGVDCFEEIRP